MRGTCKSDAPGRGTSYRKTDSTTQSTKSCRHDHISILLWLRAASVSRNRRLARAIGERRTRELDKVTVAWTTLLQLSNTAEISHLRTTTAGNLVLYSTPSRILSTVLCGTERPWHRSNGRNWMIKYSLLTAGLWHLINTKNRSAAVACVVQFVFDHRCGKQRMQAIGNLETDASLVQS